MTKRLMAMLIAVMMLLSAFILAGCNNDNSDASSTELTPKQLFEASFQKFALKTEDISSLKNSAIGESSFNLSLDKLVFGETDLTKLGEISLSGSGSTDKDGNGSFALELSAFGEKVPFKGTLANNEFYLVDLMGLNEKPIKLEMPEISEGDVSAIEGADEVLANVDKIPAIIEHATKSLETVINANIDDSAFTAEDKDVTVLGSEYKNAKIVTMTVDKVKLAKIANDLIDELMKNDDIKEMFGEDFDKTEALKDIEDFKSLRIVNTIVDETSIALSAYIDGSAEEATESEAESAESQAEAEKEDKTFAVNIECVGKNLLIEMGFANAEGKVDAKIDGAIVLDVKDDGSKFSMSFKTIDDEETEEELLSAVADITDGKYEGAFSINSDSKIEIGFFAKFAKNEGEFGITKIKTTEIDDDGNETANELPLELSFDYKKEETKLSANGKIKLAIEATADIEVSFGISIDQKDVTIEAVTDAVPMDEVDTDTLMSSFAQKYPTIFAFISMIGASMGGDAEEDEQYFEKDGLGIWLPNDFYETEMEGFTTCYTNDDIVILTLKEDFEIFTAIEDFDLQAYAEAIHLSVADDNPTDLMYDDYGMPYFEFKARGYGYFVAMFEGNEAYWLVQFACKVSDYEDNKESFADWAYYIDPIADMEDEHL